MCGGLGSVAPGASLPSSPSSPAQFGLAVPAPAFAAPPGGGACGCGGADGAAAGSMAAPSQGGPGDPMASMGGAGRHAGVSDRHRMEMERTAPENPAVAQQLLDATRQGVAKYADYSVAQADGYHIKESKLNDPRIKTLHAKNVQNTEDGSVVDPNKPEYLVYRRDAIGGPLRLIGVVYTVPPDQTPPDLGMGTFHIHHEGGFYMQHVWTASPDLAGAYGPKAPKSIL